MASLAPTAREAPRRDYHHHVHRELVLHSDGLGFDDVDCHGFELGLELRLPLALWVGVVEHSWTRVLFEHPLPLRLRVELVVAR